MSLKAQWQAWADKIAALSQRERILILLTGLVLVCAGGIYGWMMPPCALSRSARP